MALLFTMHKSGKYYKRQVYPDKSLQVFFQNNINVRDLAGAIFHDNFDLTAFFLQ
jgi:hypothetical protein